MEQPGVHKMADRVTVIELGHANFPPRNFIAKLEYYKQKIEITI